MYHECDSNFKLSVAGNNNMWGEVNSYYISDIRTDKKGYLNQNINDILVYINIVITLYSI